MSTYKYIVYTGTQQNWSVHVTACTFQFCCRHLQGWQKRETGNLCSLMPDTSLYRAFGEIEWDYQIVRSSAIQTVIRGRKAIYETKLRQTGKGNKTKKFWTEDKKTNEDSCWSESERTHQRFRVQNFYTVDRSPYSIAFMPPRLVLNSRLLSPAESLQSNSWLSWQMIQSITVHRCPQQPTTSLPSCILLTDDVLRVCTECSRLTSQKLMRVLFS